MSDNNNNGGSSRGGGRGRNRNRRGGGRRGGSTQEGGGSGPRWNPEAFRSDNTDSGSASRGRRGGRGGGPNSQFKRKDGWEADRGDTFRGADGKEEASSRSGHKYRGRKGVSASQQAGEIDKRANRGGGDSMQRMKHAAVTGDGDSPAPNVEHYRNRMRGGRGGGRGGRGPRSRFPPYWGRDEVEEGLASGAIHKGNFRINAHNRMHAYVTCASLPMDVFIDGRRNQNRAFDGDIVAVVLLDKSEWKRLDDGSGSSASESESVPTDVESASESDNNNSDSDVSVGAVIDGVANLTLDDPNLQPSGRIVAVIEEKHDPVQIGVLKKPDAQMRECFSREENQEPEGSTALPSNVKFIPFSPMDQKMPRCLVPVNQVPADFARDPDSWLSKLVQVDILQWRDTAFMPLGRFRRVVGEAGDIQAETEALLIQYHIDTSEFSEAALADLPIQEGETWSIPEEEIARRRDLRNECIFTIDPASAKDLDDALSIKRLSNGNFEVGIHIADVSFFVQPGTELDRVARERSTSNYLTQMVIPMLPRVLCEDLCSLNPAVDRLAFSTIVQLRPDGEVVEGSQWFGRSVIRSCVKLPYAFAQAVIQKLVNKDWQDAFDFLVEECYMHRHLAKLPEEKHNVKDLFAPMPVYPDAASGISLDTVISSIKLLAKVGAILRRRRFANGSVALNNVKLSFHLDENSNPIEAYSYVTKEANNLVEEFMLLTNQLVARRVVETFPDRALLRNHQAPVPRKMAAFGDLMKVLGFTLNAGSSKQFGDSMDAIQKQLGEKDADIFSCLQMLAVRSMQTAKYLSTGDSDASEWHHYALGFPVYTHFTSPIRRYPDLVVHRQLQACVSQESDDVSREELLADLAGVAKPADLTYACDIANEAKVNSRRSQEQSGRVYLCVLMGERPTVETAVCVGVGERFLNVIVPRYGLDEKVYMMDMNILGSVYDKASKSVHIYWPKTPKTAGPAVGAKVPTISINGDDDKPQAQRKKKLSTKQLRALRKEKRKARRAAQRAEAAAAGEGEADDSKDGAESSDSSDDDSIESGEDVESLEDEVDDVATISDGGLPSALREGLKDSHGGFIHQEIGLLTRFRVTIRKKANRVPIAIEFVPLHPDESAESIGASQPVPKEDSRGVESQNDFEERH